MKPIILYFNHIDDTPMSSYMKYDDINKTYIYDDFFDTLKNKYDIIIPDIKHHHVFQYSKNDQQHRSAFGWPLKYDKIDSLSFEDLDSTNVIQKIHTSLNANRKYILMAHGDGIYLAMEFIRLYPYLVDKVISLNGSWIASDICKDIPIRLIKDQNELTDIFNNVRVSTDNEIYCNRIIDHIQSNCIAKCIQYKYENLIKNINFISFKTFHESVFQPNRRLYNENLCIEHQILLNIDNHQYNYQAIFMINAPYYMWHATRYEIIISHFLKEQLLAVHQSNMQSGGREMAFDDKQKQSKKGIYRISYFDAKDLNKKGEAKLKFKYYYLKNNVEVTEPAELERINKLNLAPAYTDVWVSEDPSTKIQATGLDAKGRKQYRYHKVHVDKSTDEKFVRLYKFIKNIPKLDDQMAQDQILPMYAKNKTIALMLSLVKELNMRVGKECYAQTNKSYGITSLKKTHVTIIDNNTAKFNFKAKSNKLASYTVKSPEIIAELNQLLELPGEKIFQYINNSGNILRVTDVDLNQYIQDTMGPDFTCKDFRTYAANFYFMKALLSETRKRNPKDTKTIKKNLNLAQENTAFYLRHTKSISKKSYTMELIRKMYEEQPEWFVENKNRQPLNVLIDILKVHIDDVKSKHKTVNK
jgi:DNA topoisomerase-1